MSKRPSTSPQSEDEALEVKADQATRPAFDARLDLVPDSPGVYLMKDGQGKVIYVGKAIRLRQRLRAYFGPRPQGTTKVLTMIAAIRDFSYLVCASELEALVLESNLIKRYQPFYNILLKDDHDYPYIKVTLQEAYPRLVKAYRVDEAEREAGARYYGPYRNGDVNQALRSLHEIFPIKHCQRIFPRDIGKERPCLYYHLQRCIAPCRPELDAKAYQELMQQVVDFLDGKLGGLLEDLEKSMQKASEDLDFERAAVYRDRWQALKKLGERQTAVSGQRFQADCLGLAQNGHECCLLKLEVRGGKIVGTATHFLLDAGEGAASVLAAFIAQYYSQQKQLPPLILTAVSLEETERQELSQLLSELAGHRVRIHAPARGPRRRMTELATRNAKETLHRRTLLNGSSQEAIDEALKLLAELAGMERLPARIEAYDVTNMGEQDRSCAMTVFVHGKAERKSYRQFTIKGKEGIDDYGAMRQAIERRWQHGEDERFGPLPDLLLVDGGVGHVHSALQVLAQQKNGEVPVLGLVKDDRHRTRGIALPSGHVVELAQQLGLSRKPFAREESAEFDDPYLGHVSREVALRLLRFVTQIQDETHRRAIRAGRQLGKKRHMRYSLEDIPGVGPGRRKALLAAFHSLKALSEASVEAIQAVPGIGQKQAESIWRHFHPQDETAKLADDHEGQDA